MGMLCSMYLSFSCPFLFCVCVCVCVQYSDLEFCGVFFFFLVCKMEIVAVPTSMDCFRGYCLISTCFVFIFSLKGKLMNLYTLMRMVKLSSNLVKCSKYSKIYPGLGFSYFSYTHFFSSFLAESMIYGSNFFLFIS